MKNIYIFTLFMYKNIVIMKNNKIDTNKFIEKAKKLHSNKYDYSKVEYKKCDVKICIICPDHGEFWQTPNSHLNGRGCPKCGKVTVKNKLLKTREFFIEKAKEIHGNKYDYSKVEYKNNKTKVCIICPEHGEFFISPSNHISKYNKNGCPKCAGKNLNNEEIIRRFKEVHGNKYDYSKVEYVDSKTKVCIICPEHGEFWQTPNSHLKGRGCPKCGIIKLKKTFTRTSEQFIQEAKKIHGDKYDYSKVKYINCKEKVCIICPEHGEFWQTPDSHLQGRGCVLCNPFSKSVKILEEWLLEENIRFEREKMFPWLNRQRLDFFLPDYNIAIEYQGEQHFKPVKYFGGEKRFIDRIERDKKKNKLCFENNIKILYVSFWPYAYEDIINNKKDLIEKIYENK